MSRFSLWPIIRLTGETVEPREAMADGVADAGRTVAVLHAGRMDDGERQQVERIGHDMALASLDLLARCRQANAFAERRSRRPLDRLRGLPVPESTIAHKPVVRGRPPRLACSSGGAIGSRSRPVKSLG